MEKRPRKRQPLSHTVRELADHEMSPIRQSHMLQPLRNTGLKIGQAEEATEKPEVLGGRQLGVEEALVRKYPDSVTPTLNAEVEFLAPHGYSPPSGPCRTTQ